MKIDGYMEPDGTWFQSAMAERNTSMTITNSTKPRESRQSLLTCRPMLYAGLFLSNSASCSLLASTWYLDFHSGYGMPYTRSRAAS